MQYNWFKIGIIFNYFFLKLNDKGMREIEKCINLCVQNKFRHTWECKFYYVSFLFTNSLSLNNIVIQILVAVS